MFAAFAEKISVSVTAFAAHIHLDLSVDTSLVLIWLATAAVVAILTGGALGALVRQRFAARAAAAALIGPQPADAPKPVRQRPSIWQRLAVRALPLLAPVINILLAGLGAFLLRRLGYNLDLMADLQPLLFSWLFVTMVYVVTASTGKTIFVALLLVPLCLPFVRPYLKEAGDLLQQISLTVGKTEITALMVVQLLLTATLLMWIATAVKEGVNVSLGRLHHVRWSTRQLLQNLSTIAVYMLAIVVGLSLLGIDLTAFAVLGGALGVGIGLGLQKIASNFISGLILLSEQSIQVNDLIEVEGSGVSGLVRHTGARYTLIETIDNREIMIPNDDLVTSRVTNWTLTDSKGVVTVKVGVSYESDIELARDQLIAAALDHPAVLHDPAPACLLTGFGASSIDFSLIVHVKDVRERRAGVQSDILFNIWRRFKTHGIEIPYPQMTLRYADRDAKPSEKPL